MRGGKCVNVTCMDAKCVDVKCVDVKCVGERRCASAIPNSFLV
jgi:hypothetical protein